MWDRSAVSMSKTWWPLGQRIIEASPQKRTIYCLLQNWLLHTHKCARMWILTYAYIGICKFCCSVAQSCPSLCDPMACSMPGFPVLHYLLSLLKLMSIESVMPSNHLILYYHLLLLPSSFPSVRDFPSESALHIRWSKYWSFRISLSNEYSGLISFKIDWFDLLSVQGTLKSLLQHHSLKASVFWCSAFLMVHLSHSYITTGKTITLTIWTFASKVTSLLF